MKTIFPNVTNDSDGNQVDTPKAEIIADEIIGDNIRWACIWPVLGFGDSVSVETRDRIRPIWNRYAKLRKQIEFRFDETAAVEMLSYKDAMLRALFPELYPKRQRKTVSSKMRNGGAFIFGRPGQGLQWVVRA